MILSLHALVRERITSALGARFGLAADAKAVWVADGLAGAVSRVDPATNRVVATISVGNEPGGVALSGSSVWVTVAAP